MRSRPPHRVLKMVTLVLFHSDIQVDFNPCFRFDAGDVQLPSQTSCNTMLDESVSIHKVDKLIELYRAKNADEIGSLIDEGNDDEMIIKVDERQTAGVLNLKSNVLDSVRDKSKRKTNRRFDTENKEDKQFEFAQSVTKYTAVDSFISFKLSKPLLKALTELNVFTPTPIQCACIPLGLLNRDICACARTGSGKTLSFLLPIVERLVYAPSVTRRSTKALIISPTRELAVQIFKVAERLTKHCPQLKIQLAAGGLDLSSQEASLRTNPDIVVATPGRLIDHISNAPNFSLNGIEYLVLDEADK